MIKSLSATVWAIGILTVNLSYPELTYANPQASQVQQSRLFEQILPYYIQIQSALSTDSLQGVKEAALAIRQIDRSRSIQEIENSTLKLEKANSLPEARKGFKALSEPLVEWVKKERPAGLSIIYCPMAGAKWVQKEGNISNPYYGKDMLNCGEKLTF